MKNDTDTLVADPKRKHAEKLDPMAMRRTGTDSPAFRNAVVRPTTSSTKRTLGERIKGFFSDLAKGLEGDHETHKYH